MAVDYKMGIKSLNIEPLQSKVFNNDNEIVRSLEKNCACLSEKLTHKCS